SRAPLGTLPPVTALIDHEIVDRARGIAPVIEAEADEAQADTTNTAKTVQAMADAELFWAMVPEELGGLEVDVTTALALFEALAHADRSTGWAGAADITSQRV